MLRAKHKTQAVIAAAVLAMLASPALAAGTLSVREDVEVVNRVVLVGDVVELSGVSEEDRMYIDSLRFTSAPPPNKKITFNAGQIKGKLLNSGLELDNFEVTIPETITIRRKATIVSGKRMLDEGLKYLETALPWDNTTVELAGEDVPRDIVLQYGSVRLEFELNTTSKKIGVHSFQVKILLDEDPVRTIGLTSYVKVMSNVVTAAGDMRSGHVITEEDLVLERQDVTRLRPGAYSSYDKLLGKQVFRNIRGGEVITHSVIETIPDISSGDTVTIIFRKPGFEITARAKALHKGYIGETIKVITTEPKKILNGVVVDSQTVEVAGP